MKFVLFTEYNHKDKESFFHFLQLEGNELELQNLKSFIDNAYFDSMIGDYSEFTLDLDNPVSEQTVMEMSRVRIDRFNTTMGICKGTFDFESENFYYKDAYETAILLDETFYSCQIGKYFKK